MFTETRFWGFQFYFQDFSDLWDSSTVLFITQVIIYMTCLFFCSSWTSAQSQSVGGVLQMDVDVWAKRVAG